MLEMSLIGSVMLRLGHRWLWSFDEMIFCFFLFTLDDLFAQSCLTVIAAGTSDFQLTSVRYSVQKHNIHRHMHPALHHDAVTTGSRHSSPITQP